MNPPPSQPQDPPNPPNVRELYLLDTSQKVHKKLYVSNALLSV